MGDGGRLRHGEPTSARMESKWCEERTGMATGPARAISSGEESKSNEFDSSDCGVDVCKGVDICKGVDVCKSVDVCKTVDDLAGFKS